MIRRLLKRQQGLRRVLAPNKQLQRTVTLKVRRTDAVNYDMGTEDVIDWLAERDSMLKIDIIQANTDTVFATLGAMPADIDSFLEELYEFCPDIVDQGTGSVEGLRKMIDARVLYHVVGLTLSDSALPPTKRMQRTRYG